MCVRSEVARRCMRSVMWMDLWRCTCAERSSWNDLLRLQANCRWRSKQPNKATMRQNSYEVRTCSCSAPFVGFLFPPFADFRGSCLHIQTQSLCWFSTFLALWGGLPWKMQYLNISIIKFWFFSVLVVCYSEMNALLRVVVLSERDRHSDNVKFNKRVTEMKVCHLS